MGKLSLLAKWVENQMFNVLLEHFVVSPEILCLKQRMFFVLFREVVLLFEKICSVIVDRWSFYRNGISSSHLIFLLFLFFFKYLKQGRTVRKDEKKKLSDLTMKDCSLADSYKCIQNQNVSDLEKSWNTVISHDLPLGSFYGFAFFAPALFPLKKCFKK